MTDYNPFNLLMFDGQQLLSFESRYAIPFVIAPGIGTWSNADDETPRPKLLRLEGCFQSLVESNQTGGDTLLDVLRDTTLTPTSLQPRRQ